MILRKMTQIASAHELANKLKPWKEFCNSESFSKPADSVNAQARVTTNIDAYMLNYAVIIAGSIILALVTEPRVAIFLAAGAAFSFAYFKNFKGVATFISLKNFIISLSVYAGALVLFTDTLQLLLLGFAFGAIACVTHTLLHEKPADFV